MTSLNFEQWHEWSTHMQNEHSKLNNTECCVCYSYQLLNKNVCSECKNYVCRECSDKLEYNKCPVCRTDCIVKQRPREEKRIFNNETNNTSTITGNIVNIMSQLYNDYVIFERNYRANNMHNINNTTNPYHPNDPNHYMYFYQANPFIQNHPVNNIPNISLRNMHNTTQM